MNIRGAFTLIELWTAATRRRFPVSKSGAMAPHSKKGFTLIELLVVVTIIVVLLALLLPSMDRAIYRATLAVCATRQRATATSLHAYAFDHKRYYPHRQLPAPGNTSDRVGLPMLAGADTPDSIHAPIDIRPQLKGYIRINKQLNDPFVGDVNLEFEDPAHAATIVCSYALWFGWYYRNGNIPLTGMAKVGDTWDFGWNTNDVRKYGLLMGDLDLTWNGQNNISASHPDAGGGGKPKLWLGTLNDYFAPTYGARTFQSFWGWVIEINGGTAQRALMDTNFTYNDESVNQLNGYEYQDERYRTVPYFFDTSLPSYKAHVPTR